MLTLVVFLLCPSHACNVLTCCLHGMQVGGRTFVRSEWFFPAGQPVPENYQQQQQQQGRQGIQPKPGMEQLASAVDSVMSAMLKSVEQAIVGRLEAEGCCTPEERLLPVGCTTYTELFDPRTLAAIESACDEIDGRAAEGLLPGACYHRTCGKVSPCLPACLQIHRAHLWPATVFGHPSLHNPLPFLFRVACPGAPSSSSGPGTSGRGPSWPSRRPTWQAACASTCPCAQERCE